MRSVSLVGTHAGTRPATRQQCRLQLLLLIPDGNGAGPICNSHPVNRDFPDVISLDRYLGHIGNSLFCAQTSGLPRLFRCRRCRKAGAGWRRHELCR